MALHYYVGRRFLSGKLLNCFEEPGKPGTVIYFPTAKAGRFAGAVIGHCYDWEDKAPIVWKDAESPKDKASPHKAAEWEIADAAALADKRQQSIKSSPRLDAAVATIREGRRLLSPQQKSAFDAWLLNQIR